MVKHFKILIFQTFYEKNTKVQNNGDCSMQCSCQRWHFILLNNRSLQHPFSVTLCHWTSSHHPLWLFFVNALKQFYFVNRFLTFYCSFTVHAFVVSVIVSIWATLKNLDWLIDWLILQFNDNKNTWHVTTEILLQHIATDLEMASNADVGSWGDDGEGWVVGDLLTSTVQPLNSGQRQTSTDTGHVA